MPQTIYENDTIFFRVGLTVAVNKVQRRYRWTRRIFSRLLLYRLYYSSVSIH